MIKSIAAALSVVAAAGFLTAGSGYALTIVNDDDVERTLSVLETGKTEDTIILLGVGAEQSGLCMDGCAVAIDDGEPEEFDGSETVHIKDGEFVDM